MKKLQTLILTLLLTSVAITAQNAKEEIKANARLSASNNLAYLTPTSPMTPAPKGKKPFYISHYGRHGSRYLINPKDYTRPLETLMKADSAGALTATGRDVIIRIQKLINAATGRYGELTLLGAVQHQQIAHRMFERFPEVFKGKANINARSTTVIRCILSMENELQELLRLNPRLNIFHDASSHDMYYMNRNSKDLDKYRYTDAVGEALAKVSYYDPSRLMKLLFSDENYANKEVDGKKLAKQLFHICGNIQNLDQISNEVNLYDLFTDKELHELWRENNASWYTYYGASPVTKGKLPFAQRTLLDKIISEADSCIALPKPGATLRFGHETMVLPLTCLLGLNGADRVIDNLDDLEANGWVDYRIFPMGANIQFIFYRKNHKDADVLVKVLLNENEATLPIKSDIAPYYQWRDVRDYYRKKLASFTLDD